MGLSLGDELTINILGRDITATLAKIDRFARRPEAPVLEDSAPATDEREQDGVGEGEEAGDGAQQDAQGGDGPAEEPPAAIPRDEAPTF